MKRTIIAALALALIFAAAPAARADDSAHHAARIVAAQAARTLPAPFCSPEQIKDGAYETGDCRIWRRNAIGGGQTHARHGR